MVTDRPRAVRRWLRKPLWWTAAILLGALIVCIDQAQDIEREDRAFDTGYRVTGRIDPDDDGDHTHVATYLHPEGGRFDVGFSLTSLDVDLHPGDAVELEVARDDPTKVRLVGDHRELDAWYLVLFALLTLAAWGMRRWSVGQTERLAGSPDVAFQMTAVATVPGWLGRRWRLHLYPLDATGELPVCTVPIVAPPQDLGPRTVEVKGGVRPYGRVVVRDQLTGELIWPSGRALRSHGILPSSLRPARPVRVPAHAAWLTTGGLTLLGAGLAVIILFTDTTDVEERAYLVPALVVAADGAHAQVQVQWLDRTIDTDVVLRRSHDVGETVHLLLDPAEPTRIWGGSEEPSGVLNAAVPGLLLFGGLGMWIAGLVVRQRARRRPFHVPATSDSN